MRVLGIETSCDETAAAVVRDGRSVLSKVVATQEDLHARFGGVVPELAARRHMERLHPVVEEAVSRAGGWEAVEGVAVTRGPGLLVALLVGLQAAKGIALALGLPLTGVHHLAGHVASVFIDGATGEPDGLGGPDPPAFPFVALVASGGHTHLYRVETYGKFRLLGATRDDAAGEAYDKVAKILGLGYPGGPRVDALAREAGPVGPGSGDGPKFPRPMLDDPSLDFSFSGLKTAVLYYLQGLGLYEDDPRIAPQERARRVPPGLLRRICREFQEAAVEVLVEKGFRAASGEGVENLVVVGGVAANEGLRDALVRRGDAEGIRVHIPARAYCTDNAAMIAAAGFWSLQGEEPPLEEALRLDADPGWELAL
ncbi:MAG: tRNA (adenosine(37)-N6)-threonylcarbamoyltransferase complex transferase subunit TsaD [Nitrospinota bacterium]